MKTTIGQQIYQPEGTPDDFQADLVREQSSRTKPKIIAVPAGKRFKFGVVFAARRHHVTKSIRTWATAREAVAAGRREYGV